MSVPTGSGPTGSSSTGSAAGGVGSGSPSSGGPGSGGPGSGGPGSRATSSGGTSSGGTSPSGAGPGGVRGGGAVRSGSTGGRGGRPGHLRPDAIIDELAPLFVISVAAELAGMHAQTLRSYDREGLVSPGRTRSGGRRYSQRDIALLREVQRLSQDGGVNRAGIKRIIELDAQVVALRSRLSEIAAELEEARAELKATQQRQDRSVAEASEAVHRSYRRDLVPWQAPSTAIVTWQPRRR